MLVRVLGPAAATLQGVRWASAFGEPEALRPVLTGLPIAVQAALDRVDDMKAPLRQGASLVTWPSSRSGGTGPRAEVCLEVDGGALGLRASALGRASGCTWTAADLWERDMTLIALVGPDPLSGLLLTALSASCTPTVIVLFA